MMAEPTSIKVSRDTVLDLQQLQVDRTRITRKRPTLDELLRLLIDSYKRAATAASPERTR